MFIETLRERNEAIRAAARAWRRGPWPEMLWPAAASTPESGGRVLLHPSERLTIHAVAISSPGFISFEGIGEPIRELRELLKDLSGRNNLERQTAARDLKIRDLEILERSFAIAERFGSQREREKVEARIAELLEDVVLEPDPRKLAYSLKEDLSGVEYLFAEKRIVDVGDDLLLEGGRPDM